MPEVTFLPWLGLTDETQVAGIRLVPWKKFQQQGALRDDEREWLTKYFDRYRERNATQPVHTVTVVRTGDDSGAAAYRAIRAVAAASLVYEHAQFLSSPNPTMCPPRGERWLVFTQRFDPADKFFALGEGYTTSVYQLDSFVEVEPLSAGREVGRLERPVIRMAEALVRERRQDKEFAAALDLLVQGAMTSDQHVRRLNFVFLATAFELLAQAGGRAQKAARIADRLAEAVQKARNGCPSAENALDRAATAARLARPDYVKIWMRGCDPCNRGSCSQHSKRYVGFYQRRNRVIHQGLAGSDLLFHHRPDSGAPHRWQDQVVGSIGAHACDVALAMVGWLLLDRVSGSLACDDWNLWCHVLDRAAKASGMA